MGWNSSLVEYLEDVLGFIVSLAFFMLNYIILCLYDFVHPRLENFQTAD